MEAQGMTLKGRTETGGWRDLVIGISIKKQDTRNVCPLEKKGEWGVIKGSRDSIVIFERFLLTLLSPTTLHVSGSRTNPIWSQIRTTLRTSCTLGSQRSRLKGRNNRGSPSLKSKSDVLRYRTVGRSQTGSCVTPSRLSVGLERGSPVFVFCIKYNQTEN